MASMAEELSGQAEQLAQTMAFFKINATQHEGAGAASATHAGAQRHQIKVAHSKGKPEATVSVTAGRSARSAVSSQSSGSTAITLAKASASPAKDDDFEEF
jgi:hypothetical protein